SPWALYFSWALAVVTGELCTNGTTKPTRTVVRKLRQCGTSKAVVIHPTFKTRMALAHATCHPPIPNVRVPPCLPSASCFKPPPREANLLLPTPAVPTLLIPPAIPKLPMPLHRIRPLSYCIRCASFRGRTVRCLLSNSWEQAGHANPAGQ
uniref:Uncharacterized protein n=1 Tax=Oryza brachyantha TaxID=4533 RepID=J3LH89_ORYBR